MKPTMTDDIIQAIKGQRHYINKMLNANKEMERLIRLVEVMETQRNAGKPIFSYASINDVDEEPINITDIFKDPVLTRGIEDMFRDALKRKYEQMGELIQKTKDEI